MGSNVSTISVFIHTVVGTKVEVSVYRDFLKSRERDSGTHQSLRTFCVSGVVVFDRTLSFK